MKKKLIAGVFLATMVVSLAGCSTSKETKTTTSTEPTTVKEVETVSSTEPTTVKEVETGFTAEGKSYKELYDASDEELLSLEPMDASMFYIGYRSEPYTGISHNQGKCYISGILYSSTASNSLIDVKSERDIYDIVVLPSVDYRNEIDSVGFELPKSNTVTKGNKTFVYKNINELARIVVVPNSVERIEGGAFQYGRSNVLKRVVLPDSVKVIGSSAFNNCSNLTKINLPASIEEISDNAFESYYVYDRVKDEDVLVDRLTAIVDKGSYAETYCKEHNIKFEYREDKGESTSRLLEDSLPAWKTAYIEYFNQSDNCNFYSFNLVDINLDGIPEICTDYQQGGQGLVYINKNNEVKEIYDAGYCSYGDKDIKTQRSAMEYISTNIYRFDEKSHDYINVFLGDCSIDINGNKKYKIGNIECSEEEYNSKVESNTSSNSYADIDTAKYKKDTLIKKITDYK